MWRWLVVVILCCPSAAHADEGAAPFTSTGVTLSYGSRGFAIGLETSGGVAQGRYSDVPMYAGAVLGFDVALEPRDKPPLRAYAELEGGFAIVGVGFGATLLFGGQKPAVIAPHITLSLSMVVNPSCNSYGPFLVTGPYYRYTYGDGGLREVGTFAKVAWAFDSKPNNFCANGN